MRKKIFLLCMILLIIPILSSAQLAHKPKSPAKLSFDFIDADVRNVLRLLAEVSGKNVIMADDVKGKVTMKLDGVTWDDALNLVARNNNLRKIEDGNIIRIVTAKQYDAELKRQVEIENEVRKAMKLKLEQGEGLSTETIHLNYATASEVAAILKGEKTASVVKTQTPGQKTTLESEKAVTRGFLSPYGTLTEVKWINAIIVNDKRDYIDKIKKLIQEIDTAPEQVQIEARIVDADSSFAQEIGIKWKARYQDSIKGSRSSDEAKEISIEPDVTGSQKNSFGTLGLWIGSATDTNYLNATLHAYEKEGLLQVISHPKVVTSNNEKARIATGDEIPYQFKEQTGATATTEFKKAELSLEVTPQVTKEGTIKLKIKATKNEPKDFGVGQLGMKTREAETTVFVKDGETAVLGGIYEEKENPSEEGIPFLRHIPVLGWLFKTRTQDSYKRELLIFVTPTIIKQLYKQEG